MNDTTTITVPAREGRAVELARGDRIRVIDPNGGQVADVFAFCAGNLREYHSAEHTRVFVGRLFPHVGEQFVTNRRRPILTLAADDSPGVHDMLCAACDPSRFALLERRAGTPPARRTCRRRWPRLVTTTSRSRSRSTCS